ncbi:DUF423 domain-containing protein [Paenibacillus pasadenensis]|uniref:DUF423 domain-containing protein n=1 Tax=Paenibacillus pasadenensis TaxID=217090 RepID=UPI0020413379|nr:DUF423 domain-containing protein [Paenibacillus pasadenensis]MCM3748053.1 DUF423 domain-containing protein [Paenibacillus pasadenensis]
MFPRYIAYGAVHALISVALGAFGAHGLKERLDPDMLAVFETGAQYQMYHAIALILIAFAASKLGERRGLRIGGRLINAGIFFFSGSLYVLSMTGISWLGAIAPIGGTCFILGWGITAYSAWRARFDN